MSPDGASQPGRPRAERWIRIAWITGVSHAVGSSFVLLATGRNIALAAHLPLASAAAVLVLALWMRRGSPVAAVLLFVAAVTPALVKLALGVLHPADLAAFVLGPLYGLGMVGTFRARRGGG